MEMKVAGFLDTGTSLTNPSFAEMARAIGVYATRVEDPAELEAAMAGIFAHDVPPSWKW